MRLHSAGAEGICSEADTAAVEVVVDFTVVVAVAELTVEAVADFTAVAVAVR